MTAGSQAPTGRVIGFASAVLLVLLLTTSGWPQGSAPPPEAPPRCRGAVESGPATQR